MPNLGVTTLIAGAVVAAAAFGASKIASKAGAARKLVWRKHKTPVRPGKNPLKALNMSRPPAVTHEFGGLIYVSALPGVDTETGALPDSVAAQASTALAHLTSALAAAGSSPAHVLKCTVFLADMADFAAFNAEYAKVFPSPAPARACYAAQPLFPAAATGARVAIEAYAVRASASDAEAAKAQCPFLAAKAKAAAASAAANAVNPADDAKCPHPLPASPSPVAHPSTVSAPAAIGPYSQCGSLPVGSGLVFASGQVALPPQSDTTAPKGVLLGAGDSRAQTAVALDNLAAVLVAAGAAAETAIKAVVLLAGPAAGVAPTEDEFAAAVAATRARLPGAAVTAYAVTGLPLGARVEIEAVAAIKGAATATPVALPSPASAPAPAPAAAAAPAPAAVAVASAAAVTEAATVPPKCPFGKTAFYLGRIPAPKATVFTSAISAGDAAVAAAAAPAATTKAVEEAVKRTSAALEAAGSGLVKALKLTMVLAPAANAAAAAEALEGAVAAAAAATGESDVTVGAAAVTVIRGTMLEGGALVTLDAIAAR